MKTLDHDLYGKTVYCECDLCRPRSRWRRSLGYWLVFALGCMLAFVLGAHLASH